MYSSILAGCVLCFPHPHIQATLQRTSHKITWKLSLLQNEKRTILMLLVVNPPPSLVVYSNQFQIVFVAAFRVFTIVVPFYLIAEILINSCRHLQFWHVQGHVADL